MCSEIEDFSLFFLANTVFENQEKKFHFSCVQSKLDIIHLMLLFMESNLSSSNETLFDNFQTLRYPTLSPMYTMWI